VEPLSESCSVLPAGTGLTGGAHRSDRCWYVDSRFGVPLRSRVGRSCVGSQVQWHSSGYMGSTNLGSESEMCVGSRVHLVGVSISFEKNFYWLPFTPPLSGSPYRSFTTGSAYGLWMSTTVVPCSGCKTRWWLSSGRCPHNRSVGQMSRELDILSFSVCVPLSLMCSCTLLLVEI
jgi:hypothetical protein